MCVPFGYLQIVSKLASNRTQTHGRGKNTSWKQNQSLQYLIATRKCACLGKGLESGLCMCVWTLSVRDLQRKPFEVTAPNCVRIALENIIMIEGNWILALLDPWQRWHLHKFPTGLHRRPLSSHRHDTGCVRSVTCWKSALLFWNGNRILSQAKHHGRIFLLILDRAG